MLLKGSPIVGGVQGASVHHGVTPAVVFCVLGLRFALQQPSQLLAIARQAIMT